MYKQIEALQDIHGKLIAHLDIKNENIFLPPDHEGDDKSFLFIADFGGSVQVEGKDLTEDQIESVSTFKNKTWMENFWFGTPAYAPWWALDVGERRPKINGYDLFLGDIEQVVLSAAVLFWGVNIPDKRGVYIEDVCIPLTVPSQRYSSDEKKIWEDICNFIMNSIYNGPSKPAEYGLHLTKIKDYLNSSPPKTSDARQVGNDNLPRTLPNIRPNKHEKHFIK